jgi:hypothetical protein
MVLKKIGVISLARIVAIIYAFLGFVIGIFVAFVVSIGSIAGSRFSELSNGFSPLIGLVFGIGSIVIFPIIYGLLGFLMGLIASALYNWIVGFTGGIEFEME